MLFYASIGIELVLRWKGGCTGAELLERGFLFPVL